MPHETDPTPRPDPTEKAPNPAEEPLSADFAEVADSAGDEVAFELPPPDGSPSSFTLRAALAEVGDVPGLPGVPPSDPPSGIPPIPVSELTPMVEDPVVPEDDLVPLADTAPGADPSSSTTLAVQLDPPSGVNLTADSSTRLRDLAAELPAASEEAVGMQEAVPAEQGDVESAVNLEPLAPVKPASDWFDLPIEDVPSAEPASSVHMPAAELDSAVGDLPPEALGGSDIFGGPPIPPADGATDVSDVIVATAYPSTGTTPAPRQPGEVGKPVRPPEPTPDRPSDVALNFNAPPGGSTMKDAMASAELPVAEALPADDSILSPVDPEGLFDSARLADTPDLPDRQIDLSDEDADVGKTPIPLADASNILAELADPATRRSHDSSAVRIEAPGIDPTISDEPIPGRAARIEPDLTSAEDSLADVEEPRKSGGSIFDIPSADEIDIGVHPFENIPTAEQAPLSSSGQSSIFSPPKPGTGTADVPLSNPDATDAVDFSDHPDPSAANSDSLRQSVEPARPGPSKPPAKPAEYEEDMIDWSSPATDGSGESGAISSGPASGVISRGRMPPNDEEIAALLSDLSGEAAALPPMPAKPAKPTKATKADKPTKADKSKPKPGPSDSDQSVVVDWVAGSSEETPLAETRMQPARSPVHDGSTDPTRLTSLPVARRGRDRFLGAALGLLVGAGAFAGLYFSGIIPNGSKSDTKTTPNPLVTQQPGGEAQPPAAGAVAVADRLRFDPEAAARELASANTPQAKADLGKAQLLVAIRQGGDPKEARETLQAIADNPEADEPAAVQATLDLITSYAATGDWQKARELCLAARDKFPKSRAVFDGALERLEATNPDGRKTSRLDPADAELLVLASGFLVNDASQKPAAKTSPPPEAGLAFWKAVNLATADKYDEAIAKIDEAKKLHQERAKALAGQGLNPTTDPLEQIFPRCCDDLKAYWELKKTVYRPGSVIGTAAKKDGLAKALADAEKRAAESTKLAAELTTAKEAVTKLEKDLKAEKEAALKLDKDLTTAKEAVTKLEKDLKAEKENAVKLDKDLKAEKDAVAKLEKDLKTEKANVIKLEKDLKAEKDALAVAEKGRADAQATLDAIAKEFQSAKILPAKYDNAGLLTATKAAAKLASSPELAGAVERAVKAEAEAKIAKDELAKATKKFEADTKKLKDDQAAEVKKLKEAHALELKTAGAGTEKLKEAHALELKKLGEKYLADKKKLDDDYAAAIKKLEDKYAADLKKQTEEFAKQAKALEQIVADEKAKAVLMAKQFEAALGNAVSPAQTLDQWVTILVGLRRPEDAAPAIAAANKVLAIAPPGTEDAAKAHTVQGLAQLIKGDPLAAKTLFTQARSSAAYREAAASKKEWAKAADVGLASIDDPLAPLRRPAEPLQKNPEQAAKALDAGIIAYRAGRYRDAEKALIQAAWHDDTNPLSWYFLGAARWQMGDTKQAVMDFSEGGKRERKRSVPVRTIDLAISPIQGPARDALTAARP